MTERYCPSCGTPTSTTAAFCSGCGAAQPPPTAMADAPAPRVAVAPAAVAPTGAASKRGWRTWWARLAPLSIVLGLAASAIGTYRVVTADSGSTPGTAQTTTTSGAFTGSTARCSNEGEGYALDYPATWHTATDRAGSECALFDPEPFSSPTGPGTINEVTIQVLSVALPADRLARPSSDLTTVAEKTPTTVGGKRAIRFRTVFKDGGEDSDYEYLIEIEADKTLVLQVQGLYADDIKQAETALDVMAGSLVFT